MPNVSLSPLKEQNAEKVKRFANAFDRARRELEAATNAGIREMDKLIRELRGEVRDRMEFLSAADPNLPFGASIFPRISDDIDAAVLEFNRRAGANVTEKMATAFDSGSLVTANAFQRAGVNLAFPSVSPELLTSAAASAGDLITQISDDIAEKIINRVRISATGLQPASRTIQDIASILRSTSEIRGVRRHIGFGFQAESITRTEVGRIFSNSQQAASEQIALTIPSLRKTWITTLGERRGHRDVEDQYAEGGEIGPIPIKQRFKVKDFSRTGSTNFLTFGRGIQARAVRVEKTTRRGRVITDSMMFPRDPSGSPGNVINCTCVVIDVVPELEKAADAAKGVIEQ